MKKMILAGIILAGFMSCGPLTDLPSSGEVETSSSRGISAPVVLDLAKAYIVTTLKDYPVYESLGYLTGTIDLANYGYQKEVTIRYKSSGSTEWKDSAASYLTSGGNGREIWGFSVGGLSVADRFGFDVEFAIRYKVNGVEYWDNNGNANYKLGAGPRTFNPPVFLGSKNLVLDNATISAHEGYPTQLVGAINLKNLGYSKSVKIRYSADNWKTWKDVSAQYQYPFGSGMEYWFFQGEIPGGIQEVKAAVVYQVNGIEYWDNRYGLNYTIKSGLTTR